MTESQARTAANVMMAAAALGAAVIVLRSPSLRRLAFQLVRQYSGGPLAAWAATSMRDAWDASAVRQRSQHMSQIDSPSERSDASLSGSSTFAKATVDTAEALRGGVPRGEAPRLRLE